MTRIADAEIERLKRDVSVEQLVLATGVKLERKGQDLVGRCPFHDDHTPSFVVTPDKNLWRCFGACDVGGDAIAWVMKHERVSFRHAVELLRSDFAIGDPAARVSAQPRPAALKLPPLPMAAEDSAVLSEVVDYYNATLKKTPEALAYLEKRGLMHPDLIDAYRLGYANRTLGYRLPLATVKAGAEMRGRLQRLGVLRDSGHEHLRGSLIIPLFDLSGAVVNLYGRKTRDDLRKGTPDHLYLPGPQRGLFNPKAIQASNEIILCEALIDALTFWCAGYPNVTSAYGVSGVTDELVEGFQAHSVKRVLIAFDRDAAGDKSAAALAERLASIGIGAYRVAFPYGQDANAYALQAQPADRSLGALLRAAEWIAGGERRVRQAPELEPGEPPSPALPEPSYAGPLPPTAPPQPETEVGAREVTIRLEDRIWRARGLGRNASAEALKVNLMVRRSLGAKGEALHVDSLDLLNAKTRGAYVAEAAAELGLAPDVIKRDIGQVLLKLEALQDEALMLAEGAKPADVMTAEEERQALDWLKAPDLLAQIAADVEACGVVGEGANAEAVYLAALSRKLDRPLAAVIQSTSAAGKSGLMDTVLSLVPEEDKVIFSAMTGQSLFYLGDGDLRHKVLSIAEEEGARHASYALKLLQSQGALTIASTGKDPTSGKLVTQTYTVEGPVSLMMTTTAIDLDEELRNRCLVLTIDESREQTQAIHTRQRFEETLAGLAAAENRAGVIRLHHCAQRLIKPLKVVNPYAERLTFQDDQTRTRRDHRKYLTLIRTITLLHQHQRPLRKLVRRGQEPVAYIEATLDDIAAAGRLAHAVLGSTLDDLPPQTRNLLGLLRQMVKARAKADHIKAREVRFTRREARESTGWGDTQLRVHLGRLEELEYVLGRRDAGRMVYELAWSGEGRDGAPFVMGLIDVEELERSEGGYDCQSAGPDSEIAAPWRPECGAVAGDLRAGHSTENPNDAKAFPDADADELDEARHEQEGRS